MYIYADMQAWCFIDEFQKRKCLEFHVLPDGGVACAERDTGMALRLRLKIDVNVLRLIVARY